MAFATFRVTVYGDLYSEIVENAEEEICSLLEISEEELQGKIQYELVIQKEEDFDSEFTYKAEVIARIR
jgi:hypothetical protein